MGTSVRAHHYSTGIRPTRRQPRDRPTHHRRTPSAKLDGAIRLLITAGAREEADERIPSPDVSGLGRSKLPRDVRLLYCELLAAGWCGHAGAEFERGRRAWKCAFCVLGEEQHSDCRDDLWMGEGEGRVVRDWKNDMDIMI